MKHDNSSVLAQTTAKNLRNGAKAKEGRRVIRLPARLYKTPGGAIVADASAEVYRSEPYANVFRARPSIRFTIWAADRVRVYDDARDLAPPL